MNLFKRARCSLVLAAVMGITANGADIYKRGTVHRDVYSLYATLSKDPT